MASLGLFLAWSLLLPAVHQASGLPTQSNLTWDPPLSSAPRLPPLNGPSRELLPSISPTLSDPFAHEISSGDGEPGSEIWDRANPTIHSRTPIPQVPFDFPPVTHSGFGTPARASEGSSAPHLSLQELSRAGGFTLSTVGPSSVQIEPEATTGHAPVEISPEQGRNGTSLSIPTAANVATPGMASLPTSPGVEASDLPTSQDETTHGHHQAVRKEISMATTPGPKPTVSTIPLVTLPAGGSHVKWMATERPGLRGNSTRGQLGGGGPQQELVGPNQTTVKYMASYRSTQTYRGPQGQEEHSTTPFRPTQAAGYTQSPLGPGRDTALVASASRAPPLGGTAIQLDKGLASANPPQPASEVFPSPSTSSPARDMAGTPQGPVTHQGSTHWSLIVQTTQRPPLWEVARTENIPSVGRSATPGILGAVDINPQRVRGAVMPKGPVTYIGSSTPGQSPSVARSSPETKHPDAAGTHPAKQNRSTTTTSARLLDTPRRGLIRVTTQRVVLHRQLARPEPSLPSILTASSPPCPSPGSACSQLLPNQTLIRWGDLERTLSFAWELHVYGSGVLFLLLSLLSLACLGGSLALRVPHFLHVVAASALLLVFGLLRTTFFLADPYGARGRLPASVVRILYTAPFPLLLTTFAVLLLRLFCQARLEVLPPKWQSLPLWAVLGSVQSAALLAADLFSPPLHPAVPVGLHTLSCALGLCLLPFTVFVYWLLRCTVTETAESTPEPGVWSGAWLLLASSGLALPCCGLQFYGVLWLSGLLGQLDLFSWGWWFVQFWFRIVELVLSFTLVSLAWQALCWRYGSAEHSCWAKLLRYFCAYRKAEVPEYPNNCYDWAGGTLEKVPNNDISKNLIRNPPGGSSGRLWALKDSNALRAAGVHGSSPSPTRTVYSPKCPNAAVATMGRSYTSICFERDSVLSLAELEFRPPSPINLSRSIDEALFREHLVRDSIFLRSSLHFPSRLARQDSCSSLRGDCSTLSHTAQPLLSRPRRSSDPDCLYSLARASSMGELATQSRGLASEPPTDTSFDSFSRTSFSRASLKFSWNPWRHGLSSPESLPPEELPNQAQLLPDELPPAPSSSAPNSEREARKSFLALSKQVDSRSLSSDTIEL